MKAVVDTEGRIILPPEIRDAAGLVPGAEVDVRVRNGVVEMAPADLPVRLEQRTFLLVAIPEAPVEPLTSDEVEAVRDALLNDRSGPP